MLYQEYKKKVLKFVKILETIRKYRVLIITVTSIILLLIASFLATKGIIYGQSLSSSELIYGDEYNFSAKSLFSSVQYEYKQEGSTEWTNEKPTRVGTYQVRAMGKASFGQYRYGDEFTFVILHRAINVEVSEETICYGDTPSILCDNLAPNNVVQCLKFNYADLTQSSTTVTPDANNIIITDSKGENVTECYEITIKQDDNITFTKRPITIVIDSKTDVYNGSVLNAESFELSEGTLAFNDKIEADEYPSLEEVGETINNPEKLFVISTPDGLNVTANYNINVTKGKLTITQRPLIIYTGSGEFTYDDNEHYVTDFTIDESTSLVEGHEIVCDEYTTVRNVGNTLNEMTFRILDKDGNDVTANYSVQVVNGTLNVLKRDIEIITNSDEWNYDGYIHSCSDYSIASLEQLVQGHTIELNSLKEITTVGTYQNENTYKITSNGTDVSENYNITYTYGTLEITKRVIHVNSTDETKIYDAEEFKGSLYEITSGSIADNQIVHADFTSTITDAGETENKFSITIFASGNNDVTDNYDITYSFGTLYVEKREITIVGSFAEKMYDGTELRYEAFEIVSELGIVSKHTVRFVSSASIINVGEVDNEITIEIYEGEDNKTSNYVINYGTPNKLRIYPRQITVTAANLESIYNGAIQSQNAYTITGDGIAPNQYEIVVFGEGRKNVGTSINEIISVNIYDSNNVDVTSNYEIIEVDGVITILHREITVVSNSAEKMYDGTELICHDAYVSETEGFGLAPNEQITYFFTEGITNVGSVDNLFTVSISSGEEDTTPNYIVSYVYGELVVNVRPITIVSNSAEKIYDGEELVMHEAYVSDTEGYGLALNQYMECEFSNAITNVGEVDNIFVAIIYHDGEVVTPNYEITYVYGKLVVNKRPIHIASQDASKIYDGTPLYNYDYVVTDEKMDLVSNHQIVPVEQTSIINVSKVDNFVEVEIHNQYGDDLTDNYEVTYSYGTLEIIVRQITITTASDQKMYDGTPLINHSFTWDEGEDYGLAYGINGQYIVADITGSITYKGVTDNEVGSIIIYDGAERVTDNYEITVIEGVLEVTPREITITILDNQKIYDGTPLISTECIVGENGLAIGDAISISCIGSQTIPGSSVSTLDEWSVSRNGVDVTESYTLIEAVDGNLTVTKREITITAGSDGKIYDGTPLTNNTYAVGGMLLAPNQTISSVIISGSITNVGEVQNVPSSAIIIDADGNDVTEYYTISYIDGKLEVTPRDIVIITGSATKVYDGTALIESSYEISTTEGYGVAIGQTATVTTIDTCINVGKYDNTFTVIITVVETGEDVTSNYNVIARYGELEITQRELHYQSIGATKAYDGYALTNGNYVLVEGTLVEGHREVATMNASITLVGEIDNTLQMRILDSENEDVTSNYLITIDFGKLVVTKRPIEIQTGSAEKMFDGSPLTCPDWFCPEWEELGEILASGHELRINVTGSITDIGETPNTYEVIIYNGQNVDVTNCFEITSTLGTLKITIAPLTYESYSDSKIYDGLPLRFPHADLVDGRLMAGHRAEITYTGEVTDAGIVDNTFEVKIYDKDGKDVTEIYEINYIYGKLEVEPRDITITAKSDAKVYDGEPLYAPLEIELPNLMLDELVLSSGLNFTWKVLAAEGVQIEVGTSPAIIPEGGFQIYLDGEPVPMTNFNLTIEEGTLSVANKLLVINLWQLQKYYDGTPLSYESTDWYVLGGQLPSNHSIVVELEGSRTEAGSIDINELANKLIAEGKIKIYNQYGNDVTDEYVITFEGTPLTVSQRMIEITAASAQKVYDGQDLTANSYTISKGSLARGHYIKEITIIGSQKDVGDTINEIIRSSIVICDAEGNDVTHNYIISTKPGTLEVTEELS